MTHHNSGIVRGVIGVAGLMMASALLVAQQPLNWAADDGSRVAALSKDGARLEGEHVILWFPKSLALADAEALVKRLDPGVAATHDRRCCSPRSEAGSRRRSMRGSFSFVTYLAEQVGLDELIDLFAFGRPRT